MFFDLIDPDKIYHERDLEIEQALHISIKSILSGTDFLYFIQEADSDKNNYFNISREFRE
mgnify:CR=1 FL=1